jgi:hypothetical protein
MRGLGVRWTIGDVSRNGFEALRLSIWGAWKLFGDSARYVVCVNTVPISEVRARVGPVPDGVCWRDATREVPPWLRRHLDPSFAEGVAWKLVPLQLFRDCKELSLDNDCILWAMPSAMREWLEDDEGSALVAEDVQACFGKLSDLCGSAPRNLGIRGFPAGFDFEAALRSVLRERPVVLTSELDEQGLQLAALSSAGRLHVVSVEEVTICSPFPPHRPSLGRCGAHFCGLNAKRLGWSLDQRPAELIVSDFWRAQVEEVRARIGPHPLHAEAPA